MFVVYLYKEPASHCQEINTWSTYMCLLTFWKLHVYLY